MRPAILTSSREVYAPSVPCGLEAPNATRITRPEVTWDGGCAATLLGRLEAFLEAWRHEAEPPALARFLPPTSSVLHRETLVQLVLADLEFRYRRGRPKRIEDYVREYPELAVEGGVPCELILEEHQARRAAGETIDPREYYQRFPDRLAELQGWFDLAAPSIMRTRLGAVQRLAEVQAGDVLDDFHLLAPLGEGAFGRVFLARQNTMHRLVALKISADRGAEPQTLAQLDHPNIVRVYDQRRLPERGLRLLYMQYVAGGTLQQVIQRVRTTPLAERRGALLLEAVDNAVEQGGQLASTGAGERRRLATATWPEAVCRIGAQLAQALAYAHRRGVLHRDVKPANVLLTADGSPKLADFNVSASRHLPDTPCEAYFGGSPAYMSPEQLEACWPAAEWSPADLDERSDVYSLAILMWELLYGERPFPDDVCAEGWESILDAMIAGRRDGPPRRAWDSSDSLLAVLEDVLRRCLAFDREQRYASAERLARDLRLCLDPLAREILQTAPQGCRRLAQQHPMTAGMAVGHGPHALAAAFVVLYMHHAIVAELTPFAQGIWYLQLAAASVIGFATGTFAIWLLGRPVTEVLNSPWERIWDAGHLAQVRHRALNLAVKAAPIGICNWTASGLGHVVCLSLLTDELGPADCLHIVAAHVVCGCVAVVYPVLGGAWIVVRGYYPALIARTLGKVNDGPDLERLAQRTSLVLPFAGLIPLIALFLYAWFGESNRIGVGFVGVAGLIALPLAWRMSSRLHADLAALARAWAAEEEAGEQH